MEQQTDKYLMGFMMRKQIEESEKETAAYEQEMADLDISNILASKRIRVRQ